MKNKGLLKLFEKAGLPEEKINLLSVQTGFIQRCRKIKAVEFLSVMVTESIRGCVSCNDLAAALETEAGILASRQAYHQKISETALDFFKAVMELLMHAQTATSLHSRFTRFKRILVQDSTIVKLPDKLMSDFSGVRNACSKTCNARIQSVYNVVSGLFTHWSIHPYSQNDVSVAGELRIEAGDLILRDRGYFTAAECQRTMGDNADFISRYKHKTSLYDLQTGSELDLCRLLDSDRGVDRNVGIGGDGQVKVRLLAVEVPQEIAARRRQKAKRNDRGHNPGKDVLFLMGWTIFITSLTCTEITMDECIKLYELRWKIETIFKTWKSHMSFDKIHNVGEIQLRLILTARFIAVLLFYEKLYTPLLYRVYRQTQKIVSVIKLIHYISRNLDALPQVIGAVSGSARSLKVITQYCTYDKRKRPNFIEKEITILMIMEAMEP